MQSLQKIDQKIIWQEEIYTLGIPLIDEQHRHLVHLAGLAQSLKERDASHVELDELFRQLVDYTRYHFLVEDTLMAKFGYSHNVEHRAKHANFTEHLLRLYDSYTRIEGQRENVLTFLTIKLSHWLEAHILKEDRKMAEYLRPYLKNVSEDEMIHLIIGKNLGPR